MKTPQRSVFRRVVIGFRDTSGSPSSLEAAIRFAQLFETELLGVFIEDVEVMEWSAAPLLKQFTSLSRGSAATDGNRLAEEFSAAASMMRQRFARAAAMLGLQARFQVERTRATSLEFEGAGPEDLLVVVEPADPMARHSYPFTGVLAAVAKSRAAVLYVPSAVQQRHGPVVALFADAEAPSRHIAASIASKLGEDLIGLRIAPGPGAAPSVAAREAEPRRLAGPEDIRHALSEIKERLVVFDRQSLPEHDPFLFAAIATERRVPVLIVGEGPPE